MFGSRISLSFSRIFRIRRRRATRASDVARASFAGPVPSKPRPISTRLEPINTTSVPSPRRRSLFPSLQIPVSHSSLPASPVVTPHAGTPPPIIIIGEDPPRSTSPLPPAPTPLGGVGPRIPVDGVSLLDSRPPPNIRRVSFKLPTDTEDCPATPLSTCSTLVTEVPEGGIAPAAAPDQPPTLETLGQDTIGAAPDDAKQVPDLPSVTRSESGKAARHKSLFTPQPVRADVSRFSLPISPTTPMAANARQRRRESKRTSVTPTASGLGSTKKEKRMTRWSKEMNKPETQEVLRALREL